MAYHIGCLETRWSGRATDEQSVEPLLEVLKATRKIHYIHRRCETTENFIYHLKALRRLSSLNLIYIATHGTPFTLHLARNQALVIDELEDQMRIGFNGRILHLGACRSMLSHSETRWQKFMDETGVAAVSGYSGGVDWIESAALELLWFAHLNSYSQLLASIKGFKNIYPDLCERAHFQVFSR